MATYKTQVQYGGPHAPWHDDADLTIEIHSRTAVVPVQGLPPSGTQICWSGPRGSGSITFSNDASAFQGSAQFPGEGPVGYRGQLKQQV